ncbi:MAG: hypothetical protein FJ137_01365 [Deltaproteobacteria bacterium]|nr:hypothetical protein [Deltaproteobacteria bacterium]
MGGAKAGSIDSWWFKSGVNTARPPVDMFERVGLQSGARIHLETGVGQSICRTYAGSVHCERPRPQCWKNFFFDANGTLLDDEAPEDLGDYALRDVEIPATVVSAQLGFRDEELVANCSATGKRCTTGAVCREETVNFDHEGVRSPPVDRSAGGCTFAFVHKRRICAQ